MFQFQGCAGVWIKTAVKQCCRWSALFHTSAHTWNWNKTKLSTVGWNEAPTVGSFVLFQFYFTMWDRLNALFRGAPTSTTQKLKTDAVAVLAVLPQYQQYYRGNGYNFLRHYRGIWAEICRIPVGAGTSSAVLPRIWWWVFLTYMKIT